MKTNDELLNEHLAKPQKPQTIRVTEYPAKEGVNRAEVHRRR